MVPVTSLDLGIYPRFDAITLYEPGPSGTWGCSRALSLLKCPGISIFALLPIIITGDCDTMVSPKINACALAAHYRMQSWFFSRAWGICRTTRNPEASFEARTHCATLRRSETSPKDTQAARVHQLLQLGLRRGATTLILPIPLLSSVSKIDIRMPSPTLSKRRSECLWTSASQWGPNYYFKSGSVIRSSPGYLTLRLALGWAATASTRANTG